MAILWERAASRLTICSLCILTICKFIYSRFAFNLRAEFGVMVSPVLGHCMLVTLTRYILNDTSNVTDRVFAIFSKLCKTFKPKFQGNAKTI